MSSSTSSATWRPAVAGAGILGFVLALAAGCVSSPEWQAAGINWDRENTAYEQFEEDRAACEAQEDDTVEACLKKRGYYPWASRNEYDRVRETVPRF